MGRAPKGKIVTVIVISLLVIGFFLSIYITVDEEIPGNAVVVATTEDKLYHSIHFDHICVAGKTAQTMSLSDAEAREFLPHSYCEELGYYRGNASISARRASSDRSSAFSATAASKASCSDAAVAEKDTVRIAAPKRHRMSTGQSFRCLSEVVKVLAQRNGRFARL